MWTSKDNGNIRRMMTMPKLSNDNVYKSDLLKYGVIHKMGRH